MHLPVNRREQILDAAEELLRKYGIEKTNIVDVAKALGLSHTAVYKYFPTKIAVQEAVAARWLNRIAQPMGDIAASPSGAEETLRRWLTGLVDLKRRKAREDCELFQVYRALAESAEGAVAHHMDQLTHQLARIIDHGNETGEFRVRDSRQAAQAVLNATVRFHHPHFLSKGDAQQPTEAESRKVVDLLLAGLKAGNV
ncbi:MAG TPA: TetR/AcrR family transcriptional regulator [Bryobacteraceae bacterium]